MKLRKNLLVESLETRRLLATLAGQWTFDEGTGTTAADTSGNGRSATLSSGASWQAGNVGSGALGFTGASSSRATVTGAVVDTAQSFTVSAWVKLNALGGFQTFVCGAGSSVGGFFLQLRGDTGAFAFARLASDSNSTATFAGASSAPVVGTWYHLVGVNDAAAGTLSLYVDGQSVSTVNYTAGWTAAGNTLIGQGFYNGQRVDYVNGSVDQVQIYSGTLTSAEVSALDDSATYRFEEGAGNTSADSSGHGKTLTLNAGASWAAGRVGSSALSFNGTLTGNATNASAVVDTSLPFSVSAWVKLDTLTGYQTFASIDGTNTSGFYLQRRSNGKFAFERLASDSTSATLYVAESSTIATAGTWYHLLGVSDVASGQIRLYVNGQLEATNSAPLRWKATGATVIGGGKFGGIRTDFVSGKVDHIRFVNAALGANAAAWLPYEGTTTQSIINIATQNTGITISPDLFGLFMEDINFGGEGGVYSDLVRNSGFNDSSNALNAWRSITSGAAVASLTSDDTTGPTSALTKSGKLTIASGVGATARAGIANSGYFGVAVAPSTTYSVEFYAKASAGFTGPLTVSLESTGGTVYGSATISAITGSWAKYTATFTTGASAPTSATNRFVISTNAASANGATLWIGSAHLFPPSYQNSPAHLRVDLMEKLAAMNASFFRVPGGNYLEGGNFNDRFNWYKTIGRLEDRPGHFNSAWGYWSTDGMGLDEYLQMAELIDTRPILAVYAGYTLNGASDTGDTLAADVVDAVNELHYVLDPITTTWGALRAANGHPAPYDVREVEIGNEDWFSSTYSTRYPLFYDAIHAAFPSLQIIASHTDTGGRPYDIIDEHYYLSSSTMQNSQNNYDGRARGGADVFVGEWASMEGSPTNNMNAALGDAVWLLGLQENSDLVTMSCYAPLWANVNGIQWTPDLIGFDNTSSYGSPSYYVQSMLANHHGTTIVSNNLAGSASGLRTMVSKTGDTYYLTVVNVGGANTTSAINLSGVSTVWPTATVNSLSAPSPTSTNSITNPTAIVPSTYTLDGVSNGFSYTFPAYSLTILQFTANNSPIGAVPTIASPAAATPVTGTTTTLSVLGADDGGEANLSYTWRVLGTPPAAVTFSANASNAAKNTIATFLAAGTYQFQVTVTNAGGKSTTSVVTVVVPRVASGFAISPANPTIQSGLYVPFSASATDQFGQPMTLSLPGATWTLTGVGSLSSTGVYTATNATGTATITLTAPGVGTTSTNVTIANSLSTWYAANASGGTTLLDSSGMNHTANLTGAYSFTTGMSGNALNLAGGYASLPDGLFSSTSDFTISTWVKIDSLQMWSRIFDFGTGTNVNMFLTPRAGNGVLRFAITTSAGGGEQRVDGPALAENVWTHLAVSLRDNTVTLYVNGVAVGTNSGMTIHPADLGITNQNYLGKSQYPDPAFLGSLDDFRIYGSALSGAEVASLYNAWSMPTIATPAAASPTTVNGTSTNVSVLGASPLGESTLTYTWSVLGTTPAVTFDVNGTNGAKNNVARFTASGNYVLQVTAMDANGVAVTSTVAVSVTVPAANIVSKAHGYSTAQNTLRFTFDRDVGAQPWASLISITRTGGGTVTPVSASYDAPTRTVVFILPAGLADGDYRATLANGSFLSADAVLDFFVLVGDVNHDRSVNFTDLLIVAQNFGQSSRTFSQGNLNYSADGLVDFDDLLLLAQHYGTSLFSSKPIVPATTRRGSMARDLLA